MHSKNIAIMHLGDAASLESSQVRLWEGLDVRGEGQSGISFRIPAAVPAGEACPLLLALAGGEPSDEAALWEYGAADRGVARGKRVEDGSKVRMIANRAKGMAMWEGVYVGTPGVSTPKRRSGETGMSEQHQAVKGLT